MTGQRTSKVELSQAPHRASASAGREVLVPEVAYQPSGHLRMVLGKHQRNVRGACGPCSLEAGRLVPAPCGVTQLWWSVLSAQQRAYEKVRAAQS